MVANLLFQLRNSYRVVSAHNIWWQRFKVVVIFICFAFTLPVLVVYSTLSTLLFACLLCFSSVVEHYLGTLDLTCVCLSSSHW